MIWSGGERGDKLNRYNRAKTVRLTVRWNVEVIEVWGGGDESKWE